mgnify:CR=1 FL=1
MRSGNRVASKRSGKMEERLWSKDFILLCAVNFFMFAGFFVLLPTLPIYVVEELEGREDQVGLIIGVFTLTAVLVRLPSGIWLDQWGRKRIMILSLALFVVATSTYLAAFSLVFLLLLRLFHGAAFGISTTAVATVVADRLPLSRRGEGMGIFGTASMLAMIVGPALGMALLHAFAVRILFPSLSGRYRVGNSGFPVFPPDPISHRRNALRTGESARPQEMD